MSERKTPLGQTLGAITGICAAVWAATLLYPQYVGALVLIIALSCGIVWLVARVRQAFTFGSLYAADFVTGTSKGRARPAENPLLHDPLYASVVTQIEEAKAKHKPVRHLYAKRDHRVRVLLGEKGAA